MAKVMSWIPRELQRFITSARRSNEFRDALRQPLAGPDLSGYSLFDYRNLDRASEGVEQAALPRVQPQGGRLSGRMADLMDDRYVRGLMDTAIERGRPYENWYSIGPFAEAFLDANPNPQNLRDFLTFQTIASQRNPVQKQLPSGSYLYNQYMQGNLTPETTMAPGYGGLSQSSWIDNANEYAQTGVLDPLRWPKRTSFIENYLGNLAPGTMDTHAFRLPAMLSGDPRWLQRAVPEGQGADKRVIQPRNMAAGGLLDPASALERSGFWAAAPDAASEYGQMENFWGRAARRADQRLGQTQASGWVGGGPVTGLRSEPKLFLQSIEDAIRRTADQVRMTPTQVISRVAKGEMPFAPAVAGAAVGLGALGSEDADAAAIPGVVKAIDRLIKQGRPVNEAIDQLRAQMEVAPVFDRQGDLLVMPTEYAEQLKQYGVSAPSLREVPAEQFYPAIVSGKASQGPQGAAVYVYDPDEYRGMRTFLTEDGSAGFALKDDDIVSVFKHANSPHTQVATPMVLGAVEQGGRQLDAFDINLPRNYSTVGFRPSSRLPWDESEAPKDWDKAAMSRFNRGEPDVVFMNYDRGPSRQLPSSPGAPGVMHGLGYSPSYSDAVRRQQLMKRAAAGGGTAGLVSDVLADPMFKAESRLRAPEPEMRGPANAAAWDVAMASEAANTPLAVGDVARSWAGGQPASLFDFALGALELTDPTTWGLLFQGNRRATQ